MYQFGKFLTINPMCQFLSLFLKAIKLLISMCTPTPFQIKAEQKAREQRLPEQEAGEGAGSTSGQAFLQAVHSHSTLPTCRVLSSSLILQVG